MLKPCTIIENRTTIYVTYKINIPDRSFVKLKAKAIEIPPRKPPQVNTETVFMGFSAVCLNNE